MENGEITMKDFLTYVIVGLILWIFALWLNETRSAELPQEFSMKSETGEVVLTSEPCTFTKMGLQGYPYAAYATETGHANHEGCWRRDIVDKSEAILIYFPEIDATGVYNPKLFHPRDSLKPTVRFENNNVMLYEEFTF